MPPKKNNKLSEEQKEAIINKMKEQRQKAKQKQIEKSTDFYQSIPNQILTIDNELRDKYNINNMIDSFNPHPLQNDLFPFYTPYIISKWFFDNRLTLMFKQLNIDNSLDYLNVSIPNNLMINDINANHIFKVKSYDNLRVYDVLLQILPQLPIPTENSPLFINHLVKVNENTYQLKMGYEMKEYICPDGLSDDENM